MQQHRLPSPEPRPAASTLGCVWAWNRPRGTPDLSVPIIHRISDSPSPGGGLSHLRLPVSRRGLNGLGSKTSEDGEERDLNFSLFRFTIRTHLFLPNILRFLLVDNRSADAVSLAQQFQHLEYFPHALEMLLHQVLDDEVDSAPVPEKAILPRVLSLLSCFKEYLDIVVQCTRKTEARQWRTLFAYLPPVQELFEESLLRGSLKTAGGYLIILHTLDELGSAPEQTVRLLSRAMREQDWDLCKELARFLAAMDETGDTLRDAMEQVNVLRHPASKRRDTLWMGHNTDQEEDAITVRAVAALVSLMPSTRTMEDFVSESDSDYTSYWRDWFISSRGNEYFCEIDEDYLTDRFNLTGLNTEVQYYQYALDLVTDVFDLDCDDDMRETIEKSARHLYGLVHARYIVTTRGLQKMVFEYIADYPS
ncbi:Casein kinase II subunit beta-2 like protein [Verticillium longisporum]|nr:Casein kinase II subunit beta-2 like protein [Verticillium longisporum]